MERQTVLIVDDSELNRMMLMEILGEQYHYIEAQNGREAVRLMEKKLTVDLMLLDINMPEMNGFQVLEQMNRFRWIDEIPMRPIRPFSRHTPWALRTISAAPSTPLSCATAWKIP